jgi:hypothetical protein
MRKLRLCYRPAPTITTSAFDSSTRAKRLRLSGMRRSQSSELRPFVTQFTGRQGEYVNRPGTVNVRLEVSGGVLMAVRIGGHAVTVTEGRLSEN